MMMMVIIMDRFGWKNNTSGVRFGVISAQFKGSNQGLGKENFAFDLGTAVWAE